MKIDYKLNRSGILNKITNINSLDSEIDLSEILFADVFGIISLILLLKREVNNEKKFDIKMPQNLNVSNYLHICGFVDYIKDFANIKYNGFNIFSRIYGVTQISSNKDYIPIQVIHSDNDVNKLVLEIMDWLKNKGINEKEIGQIFTLLLELLGNSLDHGKSSEPCIFLMQKYNKQLMISIADFGIGIKECLENNSKNKNLFSTNEEAMNFIFKGDNYISSEDERGRGNGFYGLNKFIKERKDSFSICSRDGYYYSGFNNDGKLYRESNKICDLYGTHVNLNIKLN